MAIATLDFLLAVLCIGCAQAGRLSVLFTQYDDGSGPPQISVLDPQSGIIDVADTRTLQLPATTADERWTLGNGTHGQTSTVFSTNQTVILG